MFVADCSCRLESNKLDGLRPEIVEENIEKAKALMLRFDEMVQESKTTWFLSMPEPSALDAHLIVFIARMYDVKRHVLIPERLQQYANAAMSQSAWQELMDGRNTTGF